MNNEQIFIDKKQRIIAYFNDFYQTIIQSMSQNESLISEWKLFKGLIECNKHDNSLIYTHIANLRQIISKSTENTTTNISDDVNPLDISNPIENPNTSNITWPYNFSIGSISIKSANNNYAHKKDQDENYSVQQKVALKGYDLCGINKSKGNAFVEALTITNANNSYQPLQSDNKNSKNEDSDISRKGNSSNGTIVQQNDSINNNDLGPNNKKKSPTSIMSSQQKCPNSIQTMSNNLSDNIKKDYSNNLPSKNIGERDCHKDRGEKQARITLRYKHKNSTSKGLSQNSTEENQQTPLSQQKLNNYDNSLNIQNCQPLSNHSPHMKAEKNASYNGTIDISNSASTNKILLYTPYSETKKHSNMGYIDNITSSANTNNTNISHSTKNNLYQPQSLHTEKIISPICEANHLYQNNITTSFNKSLFQTKTQDWTKSFEHHTQNLLKYFSKGHSNNQPQKPNFKQKSPLSAIKNWQLTNKTAQASPNNTNMKLLIQRDQNIDSQGKLLTDNSIQAIENKENAHTPSIFHNGLKSCDIRSEKELCYNPGSNKIPKIIIDTVPSKPLGINHPLNEQQPNINNNFLNPYSYFGQNISNTPIKPSYELHSYPKDNIQAQYSFDTQLGNQQKNTPSKKPGGCTYHKKSSTYGNIDREYDNIEKCINQCLLAISPSKK